MPRRKSGAKLWFDKRRETWTIIDGRTRHRTGCGAEEISRAESLLREHIEGKHRPADTPTPLIADVISVYTEEHIKDKVSAKHIAYDLAHLIKWWGAKRVTDISGTTTRAYVSHRKAGASARRELSFLNAAIQHYRANHFPMMPTPKIKLPPKPEPRQHFMTRKEAARFLRRARRTPHLARFFLIGWYTGSRRGAITGLRWAMVNLETGVMVRKERHTPETKKKAPTIRVGDRLLAHLKRWKRMDGDAEWIIMFNGKRVSRLTRAWARARTDAKLPKHVVPHILRHSRATHMLQQGVPLWETAKYLGMSPMVLEKHYGHHQPDWQKGAANVR